MTPDQVRSLTQAVVESSTHRLEVRLRILSERDADRDRELERQQKELAVLREELHAVRLGNAVLKGQVEGDRERARRANDWWWRLAIGCATGLFIGSSLFAVGQMILAIAE